MNAVESVLGFQCNLRDVRHAVLRVSGVVSLFDCFSECQDSKELVNHNGCGCVSA